MSRVIDGWFGESLTVEQIRSRVTVRSEPVPDLSVRDTMIASEQLETGLAQIFIPNEFSLAFIEEMVGRASMHSQRLFTNEASYVSGIFNPPEVEVAPICLSGLAGVGKSQTIAAVLKLLPPPTEFSCSLYEHPVTLVSHWFASARGKASGKALLEDFVFGDAKPSGRTTIAQLLQESRRRANRDGVSLAVLEEMQHTSTGSGVANVTDILLTMTGVGPPMIYVCNYSLGHKLFGRNSEDKQRLLANPRIMLPDDPGSADWLNYVAECVRVSNGAITADLSELAAELYRCTYGLKRLAVQLLKRAYVECRDAGRQCVTLLDITAAYRSTAYTANARDVETLQHLALSGRPKKADMHLVCPFDLPAAMKSNVVKFAREERHQRVIGKVFESALTENERAAKKHLETLVLQSPPAPKTRRRAPVTKLTEEEQGKAFLEYMDTLAAPKPKRPI